MNPQPGTSPNPLIDRLSRELTPVRALRLRDGVALVVLAAIVTILAVGFAHGLWMTGLSGNASPFFYLGNGLLLVLGIAAAVAVLGMAEPRVGNRYEGPKWALAMAAVLPLAALVALFAQSGDPLQHNDPYGLHCLAEGMISSLLIAVALVLWLRRGAPVSLHAAGTLTGIAATALGSVAYGLSCSLDGVVHVGLWHAAPVAIGALVGRFVLPPVIRW